MKATATTIFIWLFLIFVTGESLYLHFKSSAKARRWEANYIAAKEESQQFKTRDGQQAVKITAQELTISELRRVNPEIIAQLKNLYIPPRLAQNYTQQTATMSAEVKAPVRDSIVIRNDTARFEKLFAQADSAFSDSVKIKVLEYRDKWIKISGQIDLDTAKIKVAATDTIFTATYKGERRRPGLWILSKRKIKVAATNKSPYITINVIQSGTIKK